MKRGLAIVLLGRSNSDINCDSYPGACVTSTESIMSDTA